MAEYINREELLKDIDDSVRFSTRNGVSAELRGAHKIVDRIRSAHACDVVEVVRCSECQHGRSCVDKDEVVACLLESEWDDDLGIDYGFVTYHSNNHYCSYGEKRDESTL